MRCSKCGGKMELVRRPGLVRDYLIKECVECRHQMQDEEVVNRNRSELK